MKNKGCSNMLAIERRNAILAKLQDERKVVVSELATVFNVTEETIRRDLDKLEKEGSEVVIDGTKNVRYESLCGVCFNKEFYKE